LSAHVPRTGRDRRHEQDENANETTGHASTIMRVRGGFLNDLNQQYQLSFTPDSKRQRNRSVGSYFSKRPDRTPSREPRGIALAACRSRGGTVA
jgi:hypothetical protein